MGDGTFDVVDRTPGVCRISYRCVDGSAPPRHTSALHFHENRNMGLASPDVVLSSDNSVTLFSTSSALVNHQAALSH